MNRWGGYCRAFWQYLHTPKGWHDFWDYLRAGLFILLTAAVLLGISLMF